MPSTLWMRSVLQDVPSLKHRYHCITLNAIPTSQRQTVDNSLIYLTAISKAVCNKKIEIVWNMQSSLSVKERESLSGKDTPVKYRLFQIAPQHCSSDRA